MRFEFSSVVEGVDAGVESGLEDGGIVICLHIKKLAIADWSTTPKPAAPIMRSPNSRGHYERPGSRVWYLLCRDPRLMIIPPQLSPRVT